MTTVRQEWPKFTDEMLEKARRDVGREVAQGNQWIKTVTPDSIRNLAWSIGDDNPLWVDEGYGGNTRWGSVIAPPCSIEIAHLVPTYPKPKNRPEGLRVSRGAALPGMGALYVGAQNKYWAPIKPGMQVRAMMKLVGIVHSEKRVGGDLIQPEADVERAIETCSKERAVPKGPIVDQCRELRLYDVYTGRLLARQLHHTARYERGYPEEGKYRDLPLPHYSDKEIDEILEAYDNEPRRGSETRFWEDVVEGEDIGSFIRGPLTIGGMIALQMGQGTLFCLPERHWYRLVRRYPGTDIRHPETNVPTDLETVHFEPHGAAAFGMPRPMHFGQQGIYWPANLLTNWMGDDAFLVELNMWNVRPLFLYEMVKIHGRVTSKEKTEEGPLVHFELWSVTREGETQSEGNATAVLLSRAEWGKYF